MMRHEGEGDHSTETYLAAPNSTHDRHKRTFLDVQLEILQLEGLVFFFHFGSAFRFGRRCCSDGQDGLRLCAFLVLLTAMLLCLLLCLTIFRLVRCLPLKVAIYADGILPRDVDLVVIGELFGCQERANTAESNRSIRDPGRAIPLDDEV